METTETHRNALIKTGQWIGGLYGCCWGIGFLIFGKLFNWGPGAGIEGPFQNALIIGIPSAIAGALAGIIIMRIAVKTLLKSKDNPFHLAAQGMIQGLFFGGSVLAISLLTSFVISFYTGAITWEEGMGILDVIQASLIMGIFWGAQLGGFMGISLGLYIFYYVRIKE